MLGICLLDNRCAGIDFGVSLALLGLGDGDWAESGGVGRLNLGLGLGNIWFLDGLRCGALDCLYDSGNCRIGDSLSMTTLNPGRTLESYLSDAHCPRFAYLVVVTGQSVV